MSKLVNAKINLSRIDKKKLFTGKKGIYLDITIWINDNPDQFGNDISIEQSTGRDESKIYLGNGKFYVKKEETPLVNEPEKPAAGSMKTLPASNENLDDLPF
jgi:hypothetical protein